MICGVDSDPVGSTLKDKHFAGLFGDLGDELKDTGAGANDRNPLTRQIMLPFRRMERNALKCLTPFDIRQSGAIELANRTYNCVGFQGLPHTVRAFK